MACQGAGRADLAYRVGRDGSGFVVHRPGARPLHADDEAQLLFVFESDLTLELQRLRPDLLFLHAGAVATRDAAVLLVGESGAGKSTLTWSLVCRGFAYLSDELSPASFDPLRVHAYPRAISLKQLPPPAFGLPPEALRTRSGFRIPVSAAGRAASDPQRVGAIFLLGSGVDARPETSTARPMSAAEAATRLLANALNPRSHPHDGLDAALEIAGSAPAFELARADLEATCERVRAVVEDVLGAPSAEA